MTKPYYFDSEPEWLKLMPAKALVSTKEVKELFGFHNISAVHEAVYEKSFPKPDVKLKSNFGPNTKVFWYPSTLRKENERRKIA